MFEGVTVKFGVVKSFNLRTAHGWISLDDGVEVRFDASGFDGGRPRMAPVRGMRVRVLFNHDGEGLSANRLV
jgi:cold shock CspA family protein